MNRELFRKGLIFVIIFLLLATVVIPATENIKKTGLPTIGKNILYVGGSGPGNYSTIQSAIDDAAKDDTIFVYNGTYIETVVVDKSINLIGEDRDITIIDADETGIAVYITANFVNISGFTIKNGGGPSSFYVGLRIESENNTIYDNILIYNYENGIVVDGSGNIISENKILSNKNGIFLDDSNNNIISDNIIDSNNKNGIVVFSPSNNNTIINNIIKSNDEAGIYSDSYNNIILANNISNNNKGVYIDKTNNNIIKENKISSNNEDGIYVLDSIDNNITKNILIKNQRSGIWVYGSHENDITQNNISSYPTGTFGIFLAYSDSNTIYDNFVHNNYYGIEFQNSDNNIISGCSLLSNTNNGVYIRYSSFNNKIYHNNFFNNTQTNGYNAHDECGGNTWYNESSSCGNFWDTYNGVDENLDGIGDTPHDIAGGAGAQDIYPLMYPWYPTHPNTVYIDDNYDLYTSGFGYDKFNRIQYGINEVPENGTVCVNNGEYFENILINKTINLVGEDVDNTVINGNGTGNVVYVSADLINIRRFKIKNSGNAWNNAGIYINSDYNTISENNVIFNVNTGIYGNECSNNMITVNNIGSNGNEGISFFSSDSNYVLGNYISSNEGSGIKLWLSNKSILKGNLIISNRNGINIDSSGENKITFNNISSNSLRGVFAEGFGSNELYHNIFINNNQNAYEQDDTNNTWDDGYPSGGNYWADYTYDDYNHGPFQNLSGHDRIGDTPYEIQDGNNQDNYPLMHPNDWENFPPENITFEGPTSGKAGEELIYTVHGDDPNGDPIYYLFDWGDGTTSGWIGPYLSGTEASDSHSWNKGTYNIRVKAKDTRGLENEWSESLSIVIPRSKMSMFFQLFERLFNSFTFLKYLFGLI